MAQSMASTRTSLEAWLRSNWRWAAFNLAALAIFTYVLTQGNRNWQTIQTGFDPMLESGKWGIRFLLICLAMTPMHTYLRWSSALKLRKSAGLWAFAFGMVHFGQYAIETYEPYKPFWANGTPWHWLGWPMQLYIALGLIGLLILTALAITSNKWSMRRLGKNWKRLHRVIYGAGIAVCGHALLAAEMSKKMTVLDPEAVSELRVYSGVLTLLLIVRIPQVRSHLLRLVAARPQARSVEPTVPSVQPSRTPLLPQSPRPLLSQWPTIYSRKEKPKLDETPETVVPGGESRPRDVKPSVEPSKEREPTF